MNGPPTDHHDCPLCTDTYDERIDLRVHLEVEHRKSEIVASFVETLEDVPEPSVDGDAAAVNGGPPTPSAD
ncbi:hypothetical protein [Halopiger djelfimassiliensis]|uniref:hypothetical protein n=1 Tax=Halopiger djelfimassiliensis TaxID=1293047 RepID=UPI0006782466|nr:hypothetical protein [Halopiger djelfimassiliensis]